MPEIACGVCKHTPYELTAGLTIFTRGQAQTRENVMLAVFSRRKLILADAAFGTLEIVG